MLVFQRSLLVVTLLLGITVTTTRSSAFERQWHVGVDLGYASLSHDESMHSGVGFGVHGAYGLTDSYNLMLELGASTHPMDGVPSLTALHGAVGAAYTLDVVSWVPYAGVLVGGYRLSGGGLERGEYRLGFQGALGMDYRPGRSWAVGLQARYHTFATDLFTTHYVTCFGRFEWLWGW